MIRLKVLEQLQNIRNKKKLINKKLLIRIKIIKYKIIFLV